MKELFGLIGNVRGGLKSSITGAVFILIFIYQYFTEAKQIELISIDTALLGLGVALLFAPGRPRKEKLKEKE